MCVQVPGGQGTGIWANVWKALSARARRMPFILWCQELLCGQGRQLQVGTLSTYKAATCFVAKEEKSQLPLSHPGTQSAWPSTFLLAGVRGKLALTWSPFPSLLRFRVLCQTIIAHKLFDYVVLAFIFLNCITIALERPQIEAGSTVSGCSLGAGHWALRWDMVQGCGGWESSAGPNTESEHCGGRRGRELACGAATSSSSGSRVPLGQGTRLPGCLQLREPLGPLSPGSFRNASSSPCPTTSLQPSLWAR